MAAVLPSPPREGLGRLFVPSLQSPPPQLWQPSSLAGISWHLTQEGRAAAEMVGEFLPLLDL